ncbi:Eco57I restriction-modification methylase domain-containing protein [Bacillus cereus]|uniref:Eco57I restriction-modification methylase domain-containing protein n=1 Tax=Bacillus cereus TaxID=1396 RepID=UPI00065B9225|nr:hypothetical protein [Bacillus cereus]KMP50160.1 hypothetical protein TU59_23305 [Bacillus cereus]
MDQKLISDIVLIVQKCINENVNTEVKENRWAEINPEILYTVRSERLALCVGILTMLKFRDISDVQLQGNQLKDDISIFLDTSPRNSILLGYYNQLQSLEKELFNHWYADIYNSSYKQLSLSSIYETLLTFEWVLDKQGFHVITDKSSRNRSGSYYTPELLAELSVRKVLDYVLEERLGFPKFSFESEKYTKHFNQIVNLLTSLKIVDFSCGTGNFLKAVAGYFRKYVLPLHKELNDASETEHQIMCRFVNGLFGVDIDFIALEIAKNELVALTGNLGLAEKLDMNFIHGNPLISPSLTWIDDDTKRKLTSAGFLYHPDLGVNWEKNNQEGFDLVVGNPPWEKLRFEEKSFLRPWAPHIALLSKKDDRAREIEKLQLTHPCVYAYYKNFVSYLEDSKKNIKKNAVFKHSAVGELNTYALFTELATAFIREGGRVCYVVKSAIVVSPVNASIFKYLLSNRLIISCYDFINKKNIFAIDNRERFCVLILGYHNTDYFYFKSGLTIPEELMLSDDMRITPEVLNLLNPLTGMMPSVTDSEELSFLIKMHSLHPVLEEVFTECKFGRLVHFTNHAEFIDTEHSEDNIPVYEGKFIEIYDGRYSTYEGLQPDEMYKNKASSIVVPKEKKQDPTFQPLSRYFINKKKWDSLTKGYSEQYSLMWRSLTSASNRRTCIATILPHLPASQSVQFLQLGSIKSLTILAALFNSVVFDYMVRLKLNGIDLTQKILKQIAVPELKNFEEEIEFNGVKATIYEHISARVSALLENDKRLVEFSTQIRPARYPLYKIEQGERKRSISEIDRLIAITYGLNDVTWSKVIRSFPNFYSDEDINRFFEIKNKTTFYELNPKN